MSVRTSMRTMAPKLWTLALGVSMLLGCGKGAGKKLSTRATASASTISVTSSASSAPVPTPAMTAEPCTNILTSQQLAAFRPTSREGSERFIKQLRAEAITHSRSKVFGYANLGENRFYTGQKHIANLECIGIWFDKSVAGNYAPAEGRSISIRFWKIKDFNNNDSTVGFISLFHRTGHPRSLHRVWARFRIGGQIGFPLRGRNEAFFDAGEIEIVTWAPPVSPGGLSTGRGCVFPNSDLLRELGGSTHLPTNLEPGLSKSLKEACLENRVPDYNVVQDRSLSKGTIVIASKKK